MIDAIKEITTLIEKLPHMALWILAGVLIYKVIFIGSWFGIAKLLIDRTHSFLTSPKPHQFYLDDLLCQCPSSRLIDVLKRIPRGNLTMIHASHIDWLKMAIDEKAQRDSEAKK